MQSIRGGRREISIRMHKGSASVYAALFLGLIVFFLFWLMPLAKLGAITTPYQDPDFGDSNFYLYHAAYNCAAIAENREYQVTWSSVGIVTYLTYSCFLTQHYLGFVVTNALLVFISYSYYLRSFRKYSFSASIIFANALCIYTFCLLLSPGKEVISFAGLCFVAGGTIRHASTRSTNQSFIKNYSMIALGIVVTASSRFHEAAIICAGLVIYIILRRFGYMAAIATLFGSLFFIDLIVEYLLNVNVETLLYFGDEYSGGLTYYISTILISENPIMNAMLAPLRIIIVPLGSFLNLFSARTIHDDSYFLYRDVLQRFRAIDMVIFLLAMYRSFKWRREPVFSSVVIILLSLTAITWAGILEKSRYFFVYIPLLTPFLSIRHRS